MSIPNIAPNQVPLTDKHTHTYKRHPTRKGYSYCLGADCQHIQETKLLVGKRNKCKCGKLFILTREDLRRAIPRCINCSTTRIARERQIAKQLFESLDIKVLCPDLDIIQEEEDNML
jgi:hypothetical protein